jgi:16S rRNA (cytosine1402-N4)-methyltransferase
VEQQFEHEPVMAVEVARWLAPRAGGIYCDATVGGGGHAARILGIAETRLVGIDRDPAALDAARARLASFGDRVTLVHGDFSEAPAILRALGAEPIDGFVLDLGVSSPQLDQPARGFSFRAAGPLDMRMDPTRGETAADLLRRVSRHELEQILRDYGEERFAGRVARAIKEAAGDNLLHSTTDLAAIVAHAVPTRERKKDPATRTFQALRIAVNRELDEIERFLSGFAEVLAPGGRVVIITFHSLEDRIVKHRLRALGSVQVLTKKPLVPADAEIARNPRARSAKLRVAEKAKSV